MKRIITIILLIFASITSFSQIQVKEGSFRRLPNYVMDDKDEHVDGNNMPMALIKISTENINEEERQKLYFKGNRATDFQIDHKIGEVYLYLTAEAATFIEIKHPDYGKTMYTLPETLCNYCAYELVVQYIPIVPAASEPEPVIQKQYLIVKADQPEALIYIDDEPLSTGEASKLVDAGTSHTYKIECNLYHTETGSVTVNERTTIEKQLRPNFGYLNISTSPEQGATVFVDGNHIGVSPIKTDKLKSGSHTVRVVKDMFKMTEQSFTVADGQTTNANINMSANFVNVTVNVDSGVDIYVDDEYKGKGRWTGRLSDGSHIFEARMANHKSTRRSVELVLGEIKTISLEKPTPIYGSLDINSSPMNANIYIDGKQYGQTPNYINEILIGSHELRLEKTGCATLTKTITVKEGETLSLNETLQTGRAITISTDQTGDRIYVDDKYIGTSPITSNISYGSHQIKAERNGETVTQTINVTQYGGDDKVVLAFGYGSISGHAYVDLGLPSGIKWATCNVGADSPEDYGDYFAWGEVNKKASYTGANSKTYCKSSYNRDIGGDKSLDAASANWGGSWRLPTEAECKELKNKCKWEWTTQKGVNGYKVTGPNGNSIFLPAAGCHNGSSLIHAGEYGSYWSSTPYESYSDDAYSLYFSSESHNVDWSYRFIGRSVRLVSE